MNELFLFAAQNMLLALILAALVLMLTRFWRQPAVAHLLWLLVLARLVMPPIVSVPWPNLGKVLRLADWARPPAATAVRTGDPTSPAASGLSEAPVAAVPLRGADLAAESTGSSVADRALALVDRAAAPAVADPLIPAATSRFWIGLPALVLSIWLGGALLGALMVLTRIARFERLLAGTLPASMPHRELTARLAATLGLHRVPAVRYVESAQVPFVWFTGRRPTIVLPRQLMLELDEEQTAMILAHELAHLRRRDHWVRLFEMLVSLAYWWNPLVWFVRRQLHAAEDLCCDAWVRLAVPDRDWRYAEVLFQAAQSIGPARLGSRLQPASSFLHSQMLKARIEMILGNRISPRVSAKSLPVVALVGLFLLPSLSGIARQEALAQDEVKSANDSAASAAPSPEKVQASAAEPQAASAPSADQPQSAAPAETTPKAPSSADLSPGEFPHLVKFEQGASKFLDGDKITIEEVRGTAATMTPGNVYRIKGTYTLASHDRARLAASTTAKHAKDGMGSWLDVQTAEIDKGSGNFTLYFPMWSEGWPHVSFYPSGGGIEVTRMGAGEERQALLNELSARQEAVADLLRQLDAQSDKLEKHMVAFKRQLAALDQKLASATKRAGESFDFGGSYFGTGESVLRQWWDSERKTAAKTDAPPNSLFPYSVPFDQGMTKFLAGDSITILEVRGTSDTMTPGNLYWIRGTYNLASHEGAQLAAYVTATDPANARSRSLRSQTMPIVRGSGGFTLFLPMPYPGYPHVSFYDTGSGEGFGGNYFGTGQSLRK
ncbi:MAG TPA: M56 family metallopeptidase [Pirellulales bacterium]|nr:M56 family metallopeptidase [Pirellulales bacterium]